MQVTALKHPLLLVVQIAKLFTDLATYFPLQDLIFHCLRRSPSACTMQNRYAMGVTWSSVMKSLFLGSLPHLLEKGKALQWIR